MKGVSFSGCDCAGFAVGELFFTPCCVVTGGGCEYANGTYGLGQT